MNEKRTLPTVLAKEKENLLSRIYDDFYASLEGYKENGTLQGLFLFSLSLLSLSNPITAFATMGTQTALFTWAENRKKKWTIVADELNEWEQFSSLLLENADFLHCFAKAMEAIEATQSEQKIHYLTRLLKASTDSELLSCIDEYEEYLAILNELSYRELSILAILDKYENQYPLEEGEGPIVRSEKFWDVFIDELTQDLQIPKEEVRFILSRLDRTGCYQKFIKTRMGAINTTGDSGRLTPTYYHLRKLIISQVR